MSNAPDVLRAILGKGSIYTAGTILRLAGGLLVLPILTRILSPEQYGLVATAIIVQTLLALVSAAGLPAALVRIYFKDNLGPEAARSLIFATLLIAIGVALFAELTGPIWSQAFDGVSYGAELRLAVWSTVSVAALDAIQSLLNAQERPGAFVAVVGTMTLGVQGAGVALAAVSGDAMGYLLGYALGGLVALLVGLGVARVGWTGLPGREAMRFALKIGLPVVPHSLALYIMAAGDRIVIENLEGLGAVGRFHLAYVIGSLGLFIASGVNQAWSPIIFKTTDDKARWRMLADTSSSLIYMAALTGGMIAIIAPLALDLLAPPGYRLDELAPVSALVAGAILPFTVYLSAVHVLFFTGRTIPLAIVTTTSATLNIGLNFLLIPHLGLLGAAIATLAAYSLQAVLIISISSRLAEIPWHHRRTAVAALLCGSLIGFSVIQPEGGWWTVVRIAEDLALLGVVAAIGIRGARGTQTIEAGAASP